MADDADKDVEVSGMRDEVDSGDDGSGGSSSSDSGPDEETEKLQIAALEKAVVENPSNYEAHVQYIQSLRRFCHFEKLRQARKSMSELFPLTPEMWREWAKDEITLNSSEAVSTVEEIYEKGVHEYLSVPLWLDYINFIEEHDQSVAQCTPDGISKMRNLYERAISSAGLHVVEGSKVWGAYREFEEAILLTIDDANIEEKAKQTNRVRALFHRQLSVPLADMNSTFLTYKQWEIGLLGNPSEDDSELDVIPKSLASSYQRALDMFNARVSFEDQLSASNYQDSDRLQQLMSYIKFEDSSGNPARVQTLYERVVSEFPISSDVWLEYTSYMDKTLKIPSVLKDVYSRATRNCSWIGSLWVQYLLSLERVGASENELSAVFEQSLLCSFSSFKEYLDLFLTRIDGLRRRIPSSAKEDYTLIRETFERVVEYLSPEGIGLEDTLHLYDYWARLEMGLANDLKAARGVWESLLKKSGTILEFWKGYIDMEIRFGNTNDARSIYKRCYSKKFSGNGSEDICHSWLRFEREFGSLDDYDLAMKKVLPRLKELGNFKIQEAAKSTIESAVQPTVKPTEKSTVQNDGLPSKTSAKKRKTREPSMEKQAPAKKQKDASPESSKVPAEDSKKSKSSVDLPPKKSPFYTDQCTAFVSNLNLEVKEEDLREFFGEVGGVTAIRLVKDKFTGKSKGFAYVDFSDDEHLSAAIVKNREILQGKKISIARSDPKQGRNKGSSRGGFSGGRGGREASSFEKDPKLTSQRRVRHVELSGSATFAVPRSVKPLGWSGGASRPAGGGEEQPKSNEEFRSLLTKK